MFAVESAEAGNEKEGDGNQDDGLKAVWACAKGTDIELRCMNWEPSLATFLKLQVNNDAPYVNQLCLMTSWR